MAEYTRLSARVCNTVKLDVSFLHNGILEDPYALHRVDIYKGSVKDENLVAQVPLPPLSDPNYPFPVQHEMLGSDPLAGKFYLLYNIPADFATDIYFDVWRFTGTYGCGGSSGGTENEEDESTWTSQCNRFWVYPDGWYVDDGLVTIRFGFEPLDKHYRKPEIRNLEVGLMPLPLYDFDYNRVIPLIPQIQATIRVDTENCETIVENEPCRLGIRQGSYRTNPFVVQYRLDTSRFLIGTYKYRINLLLPNGETLVSDDMRFDIS